MRLLILGGLGWFGRAAADLLRRRGERPLIASRRPGADLHIDAEDAQSLLSTLRPHDIIIDAAGPFQRRSTQLIETCITLGCDVIDLSDSLHYAMRVQSLAQDISAAGIRVLNACSSVSAVSAVLIRQSGISRPVRVSVFLAPATANTSTGATARALVASFGGTIRVRRGGQLIDVQPFADERLFSFPPPVGMAHGRRAESADALLLPQVWPSLQDVDFWVDTRRRALNSLFAAAARHRLLRSAVEALLPIGRRLTKIFGARSGGYAAVVEDGEGRRVACGVAHASHSYLVAVAPAVLAAQRIAAGRLPERGLLPPDRHVDHVELIGVLRSEGIDVFRRPEP
jgi:saccharopine dehydrogenase-like NADP-dependent oxidoreductase